MLKKKTTSFRIAEDLFERFQRSYPRLLSQFIERAVIFGLRSRDNFERIYFMDLDKEQR